jgi:enoyl-CoA hydratase/carnithine racemase
VLPPFLGCGAAFVCPRRWRQNEFGLGQANQIFAFLSDAKIAGQAELEGHMHIFMGQPLNPRDAETKGLVRETVSGKALDRAMEIARRLSAHTPEYLGYIKRLIRNAIDTPLAEGLALERNLFMRLCVSDQALARMRSYEEKKITDPSRSLEA